MPDTTRTAKIFLEGEHPRIVYAAFDTDKITPLAGDRIRATHGTENLTAVVLEYADSDTEPQLRLNNIKDAHRVFDSAAMAMALATFVSDYYLAPMAAAIEAMLPPVQKRLIKLPQPAQTPTPQLAPLNAEQQEIVTAILATDTNAYREHLIWGVTGSGKTRIYEHLIEAALKRGEQTLFLLPEIALSSEVMRGITARFPEQTVLYHSSLSAGERALNHRRFLTGDAKVAIGTRSAVFLPASNLGLIIVDEEHDASFKDQRNMRFDTRTVARLRQRVTPSIQLVLGSATPAIESIARARSGEARLYRLKQRATRQPLPHVYLPEYKLQHGLISPFLHQKMREHLAAKNQVLLLMNRRGHSTHVHCALCEVRAATDPSTSGYAECPRCAVALAYHKDRILRCHHCGYSEPYSVLCPKDGSERRLTGRGIQRVEEILDSQFGEFEYARLDRDTTRKKGFVDEVMRAMQERKLDILVGTQMVAKGFDLPNVTLVGVLAIDQMLAAPDFRAAENAWQLLTQVIGRSGRHLHGEVVIQTTVPHHAVIRAAETHDADSFYAAEAAVRRLTKYPPFTQLARLLLYCNNEAILFTAAERLAKEIRPENLQDLFSGNQSDAVELLGPAIPSLSKSEDEFRVHFLIKATDTVILHTYLRRVMALSERLARAVPGLRFVVDIDPRETG
ncbi:MAG: primosomal protein N' [Spirochaetes bacterium]|nr:primosomal protein N' [Spirochaetota bacterium]